MGQNVQRLARIIPPRPFGPFCEVVVPERLGTLVLTATCFPDVFQGSESERPDPVDGHRSLDSIVILTKPSITDRQPFDLSTKYLQYIGI